MDQPQVDRDRDDMPAGVGVLIALSIIGLAAGLGVVLASHAWTGLGILGASGIVAIWARIAQAGYHQEETLAELRRLNAPRDPSSSPDRTAEAMSEREWQAEKE